MGYETESIYKSLRTTLDELGFHQALSFDSLYLVKALVADLIQTTQSLKHYKELCQTTLAKCNELEVGLQPFKEDNARLVQECNRLHKKLIVQKDNHEDAQKELKFKLRQSDSEKESLEFNIGELTARLADIERECLKKNERIHELQNVILKRHPHRNLSSSKSTWGGKGDSGVTFESKLKASTSLDSTVQLLKQADINTKALKGEVKELQQRLDNKEYVIDNLQTKLNTRNTEITRLTSLLEGGRPVAAVIQDHTGDVTHPTCIQSQMFCTCNKKPAAPQAQGCRFSCLEQRNTQLEKKLKECLRRQHDAMQHALRLADKNKMLEVRLKSVEKNKDTEIVSKEMTELQDKISSLTKLIEDLRKENQSKQNQPRYTSTKTKTSFTTSKSERESVQLREKVEDYKILEKDLMSEIDRLERDNSLQKTYITELEYKLLQCLNSKEDLERAVKVKDALRRESKEEQGGGGGGVSSTTCDTEHKFESLIKERDHYQKEYAFIVDKLTAIPLRTHTVSRELPLNNLSNLILERDEYHRQCESLQHGQRVNDNRSDTVHCELKRRLSDQGQEISSLKHKYKLLEQEYADLSSLKTKYKFLEEEYRREKVGFTSSRQGEEECRREKTGFTSSRQGQFTRDEETDMSARRRGGSPSIGTGVDLDTYLNLQEERDRLFASNVKLQEEKGELLSRLKRVQIDACSMNEDRIRSLESERCHLITKQTELNSRLGELEEENRGLKRKLYVHENELSEERNSLNSIRRVQEQTDQALLSFRKTHDNLESQIRDLKDQNNRLEAEKDNLVTQVESLREDNARMRSCMMSLDGQKDSILMTLDSKIDLISRLERDMCSKDSKIEQLEDRIAKFKTTVDETLNLNKRTERELKLATSEVERLKVELNSIDLEKSRTQAELRRIQAELYEVNQHNRTIQQELEASKSEAEEVKLQLQHYCCEVQRIEEILSKKENERLDLLKHLKFISQETAELENNNHSLDGEMKSCKNLLTEAEKKVMRLEALVQDKDCAIKSLETKLQELSCVTAQLETQVQSCQDEKYRVEGELATCQETMDQMLRQKEELRQELNEKENFKNKETGRRGDN